MGRNAWAGAVALLAAGIGLTVAAPPASALNVVNVTTTTDGVAGSLRAAIDTAATDGDDTEIVLQAGSTYELTVCGPTDDNDNASGDLDTGLLGVLRRRLAPVVVLVVRLRDHE